MGGSITQTAIDAGARRWSTSVTPATAATVTLALGEGSRRQQEQQQAQRQCVNASFNQLPHFMTSFSVEESPRGQEERVNSLLHDQAGFITTALCFAFFDSLKERRNYLIPSSSISNVNVALGGMLGGLPLAP
jgi:hypothetical protein